MAVEYTGYAWDAVLGLYFAQARMYDAGDKRFMAMDWIKGTVTWPMTLNPYVYVVDNPIKYVDLLGLEKIAMSGNYASGYATRNFIEPAIKSLREWFREPKVERTAKFILVTGKSATSIAEEMGQ